MDVVWGHLSRTSAYGSKQSFLLSQAVQTVITIPHSNAAEERVFSTVWKNKTPFRPNLNTEDPLGSIVTTKTALPKDTPACKFEPPKELLVTAKGATKEFNQAHSRDYYLWVLHNILNYMFNKLTLMIIMYQVTVSDGNC